MERDKDHNCESAVGGWSSQNDVGRDELNIAEFPLTLLADRAPSHLKSLQFADRIWDKGQRTHVTRRLTITGSDQYGLPTALDDEVILGLIQLTHAAGFANRVVPFRRHALLRLLGWRNEGKSYRRLDASLRRWLGVTLYYEKAWRDKDAGAWVDEHFHLLERVTIRSGSSSFSWNEVPFRSFQAGNLKRLDMHLYRQLSLAVSKRLYRFLDKRFYHRKQLTFDLRALAHEHLGLSRSYKDAAQLKRRLKPALAELELKKFLVRMPDDQRYERQCRGRWRVTFQRARDAETKSRTQKVRKGGNAEDMVVEQLSNRGIVDRVAASLARQHPVDVVRKQLDAFDWLVQRGDVRVSRNPPGYLVHAIRENYAAPAGFSLAGRSYRVAEVNTSDSPRPRKTASASRSGDLWSQRLESFWCGLSPEQQSRLDEVATQHAKPFLRAGLEAAAGKNPKLAESYRQAIRSQYLRNAFRRSTVRTP